MINYMCIRNLQTNFDLSVHRFMMKYWLDKDCELISSGRVCQIFLDFEIV